MLRIDNLFLRVILLTLALLGILFFLLPMTVRIINAGNLVGLAASVILFCFIVWNQPISAFLGRLWQKKGGKPLLIIVFSLLIAGVLLCLILSVMMFSAARKKPAKQAGAVIVLGCKVRGNVPSLMLSRRIHAAYEFLSENPELYAVVSGGKGADENISEAECIKRELIQLGISADRIITEDQSTSTSENLRFSKEKMQEHQIEGSVWIVTDGFHQKRAQYLAKREGLSDTGAVAAYTSWYLLPTYWVREWFGLVHAYVLGS